MPSIQTSKDSIEFTSKMSEKKDLDSLCFHGQNDNNKTDIQVFVEYVHNKYNLDDSNIGFSMLCLMRYNTLEILMEKIASLVISAEAKENFVRTTLKFTSLKNPKFDKYTDNWSITINGIKELEYAKQLLFVYQSYVKPFMDELNYEIQYPGDIYYRFFYYLCNYFC
jgi:hypothetical protein